MSIPAWNGRPVPPKCGPWYPPTNGRPYPPRPYDPHKDHKAPTKKDESIYTIVMDEDKHLIARNVIKIYQREKLVNKIQFIVPSVYGALITSKCSVKFKYLDQGNVAHIEELELSDDPYKGAHAEWLCYVLPVDTKLTRFAGDITGRLTFYFIDEDEGEVHLMQSDEITITVSPLQDYYAFVDDESLEVMDQKILELDARIEAATMLAESIDENKADNLVYEDDELQLTANGERIGDSVKINSDGSSGNAADDEEVEEALDDVFKNEDEENEPDIATDDEVNEALDDIFKVLKG